MVEQRDYYRVDPNNIAGSLEFILNRISERLDIIEGLRGIPTIYSTSVNYPNISASVGTFQLTSGVATFSTSPAITDFSEANHDHEASAGGGQLDHGNAMTAASLNDDDHSSYLLASDATDRATFATNWLDLTDAGATSLHKHDHNAQDNLAVGDVHTHYLLLAGRAGGQTAYGGTAASENLTLGSTSHATKGLIKLGTASAYDEVNKRLGINNIDPQYGVDLRGPGIEGSCYFGASTQIPYPTTPAGAALIGGGSTSHLRISVQDGSGRSNFYWNAYYDATLGGHRAIVGGGEYSVNFEIDNGIFEIKTSTGGATSAGDAITWRTGYRYDTSGSTYLKYDLGAGSVYLSRADAATANVYIVTYSDTSAQKPTIILQRSKGSFASKTVVASGDDLGTIISQGYDGTAFVSAGIILCEVDAAVSAGVVPGRLTFKLMDAAGTLQGYHVMKSDGKVGIKTTEPSAVLDINGDTRFGDHTTNYVEVEADGDMNFVGGAGLQFAEIYGYDTATTITISGTGIANKAQITAFAVDGQANGSSVPDHTNDHITIGKAGKYEIICIIAAESGAGTGFKAAFNVYINNGATQLQNLHAHENFAGGGGDYRCVALSGYANFAVNDTVEVWCWNETNTDDIIIDDINLTVKQIGG